MFLSDIHAQLHSGELSQLFEGEGDTLNPEAMPKINQLIQAGINDLNKHFSIRENELLLSTKIGKDIYELVPANAFTSGNPYPFILDSVDRPFLGDIMQILRITDSNGSSLWMNTDVPIKVTTQNVFGTYPSAYKNQGINLLSYNTLKFSPGHNLGDLLVHYKAKMKPIDMSSSPDTVFIDIPDHYLNALVLYVASRKYNPMGSETIGRGMFHEGNNYWSKYQAELAELKANLGSIGSTGETTNFYRGGWV